MMICHDSDDEFTAKPDRSFTMKGACQCCDSSNNNLSHRQSTCFSCFSSARNTSDGSSNTRQYAMINKHGSIHELSERAQAPWPSKPRTPNGRCSAASWSVLPVVLGLTSMIGFIITYIFAKNNCHVEKWIIPYVSYTGTEYPESMIFGLILNTEGFLGSIIVFLAWRYYRHMGQRGCFNTVTLCVGMLSCFGVVMVGNFQVTKAKLPHYVGAGLAFIVGTGYGICTAILSRKAFRLADPPLRRGTCVAGIRLALAVSMIIALVCLSGVAAFKKLSTREDLKGKMLWKRVNGSCVDVLSKVPPLMRYVDLLGSLTEWLLTVCLLICLSLFSYEFQTFHKVKVVLLKNNGPLRCRINNFSSTFGGKSPISPIYVAAKMQSTQAVVCSRNEDICSHNFSQSKPSDSEATKLQQSDVSSQFTNVRSTAAADSGIEDDVMHNQEGWTETETKQFIQTKKETHSKSLPNLAQLELV